MAKSKNPIWWEVFISEYLRNGQNGKQAYLKARPKVSERTAEVESAKLLRKPEFEKLLNKATEQVCKKIGMSNEKWLEELISVAETKKVKVSAISKLKALEIIGKSLGYLTEKVEHSGTIDLAARIVQARKRAGAPSQTEAQEGGS